MHKAKSILETKRIPWGKLGELANGPALKQGRHRGKNSGNLRNATAEELKTARIIAKDMIHQYLRYIEDQP